MAFPLLLPVAKGLLGAGLKAGAKKALMNKAKDVAKDKAKKFVSGKLQKKKKGGALAKTESGAIAKQPGGAISKALEGGAVTSIKEASKVQPEKPKIISDGNKIGFDKLNTKLLNVSNTAASIDEALKGQYAAELEENKKRKKAIQDAKRRRREGLLESGKEALKSGAGTIGAVAGKFNLMDFIKNVLLGGLLLALVKNFQKIMDALNFMRDKVYIMFHLIRGGLKGFLKSLKLFKGLIKGVLKIPKLITRALGAAFRGLGTLLKAAGRGIGSALRKVGDLLFDFGGGLLRRLKDLATGVAKGVGQGAKAAKEFLKRLNKLKPLEKLRKFGGAAAKRVFGAGSAFSRTRAGNFLAKRAFDAKLGLREAGKKLGPAARATKEVLEEGVKRGKDIAKTGKNIVSTGITKGKDVATAVKGKVSPFLKKFIGEKGAKAIRDAGPAIKQMKGPLSKVKIPVIGPLITLVVNLLDPDVSAEESIFKTLGVALGEMAGTAFIPIPVVGTILGGIIGEYAGSLLYTLFRGGGISAFQKRISKDFAKALDIGGKAVNYVKESIGRFYEGVPKFTLPGLKGMQMDAAGFVIDAQPLLPKKLKELLKGFISSDKELPNPLFFGDFKDVGKLLVSSFFPEGIEMPKFNLNDPKLTGSTDTTPGADAPPAGAPSVVPGATVGAGDADLFQRLVLAESQGEGKLGMAAVARSVMNRLGLIQNGTVSKGTFLANDDTLRGVIYGPQQYQPTRDGSIDRAFSATQKQSAQAAINLAKDPDALRAALIGSGVPENEANILLASTGFRTAAAGYDASQDVNVVKFKNHLFNTAGNPGATAVQASTPTATPTTPMVERYTSPSQEEAKAKKKVAFLLRASAAIDGKKLEKKGDETKVIIPGLGFYMSGRGLFSGHVDKYFDENANQMTEEVFMKRLKNMENVQRGIMKTEKEKSTTGTESLMGTKNPDEISGDPATSGGASDPSSVPTGTGLKDTISQKAIDVTYGTPSGPVRTRGRSGHHAGIDIGTGGQKGWYVAFKMKGKVSLIGNLGGYGNTVIIEAGGYDFLFAHLAKQSELKQGQDYNGEIIGEIGNTGVGSGEHLHFEVRSIGGGTGSDVDPEPFTKHLVIGRMGDGSAVGTTTGSTLPQTTTGPTVATAPAGGQGISGSPTARNLEQYPSYDGGSRNIVMIAPPGQIPQTRLPSAKRTARAQTNASMSQVLNSYYKRQLLGLLYKVG